MRNTKSTRTALFVLTAAGGLAVAAATPMAHVATAHAPESSAGRTAQPENLPDGMEILERHAEAIGGRAAFEGIDTLKTVSTLEIPMAGVQGTVTTYAAAPRKLRIVVDIPQLGQQETGYTDGVAWSNSELQGPQIMEGEAAAQQKLQADFYLPVEPGLLYSEAEAVGTEDVEGEACYKVELVTNDGLEQTSWYSIDSGLQLKTAAVVESPQGEITNETLILEYMNVRGIKIPKLTRSTVAGTQEVVTTVEEAVADADLPEDAFEMPEEVKQIAPGR